MSEQGCTHPQIGDLLASYELNLLESDERRSFEDHLDECTWCLGELYAHAEVSEALRAAPGRHAATLRAAARHGQDSIWGRIVERMGSLLRPRVLVSLGAALALALTVVILSPETLVSPERGPGLARIEALPYQPLALRGGEDTDLAAILASGLQSYADGDYGSAASELERVWREAGNDESWNDRHRTALYLGLSLLLDGRPDESVAPLEVAVSSPLLPVAERGRWYLAQAHLLRERPEESLPLLESLLQSPVYGDPAADQLISVREICDNSHGS